MKAFDGITAKKESLSFSDSFEPILENEAFKTAYSGVAICRCCCAIIVALTGFVGVVSYIPDQNIEMLELSFPCHAEEHYQRAPCTVYLVDPPHGYDYDIIDGGSVDINVASVQAGVNVGSVSGGSDGITAILGQQSGDVSLAHNQCSDEQAKDMAGDGSKTEERDLSEKCPLIDGVLIFDEVAQTDGTVCRKTKCLEENGWLDTWKDMPHEDTRACIQQCPYKGDLEDVGKHLNTVVLKQENGAFVTALAEMCGVDSFEPSDIYAHDAGTKYAMTDLQQATFERYEWTSDYSKTYALALVAWVIARFWIVLFAYREHVGISEDNILLQACPAIGYPLMLTDGDNLFCKVLRWTKFIWLVAPANALLFPLTTLRFHDECSHILYMEYPGDFDLYTTIVTASIILIPTMALTLLSGAIRNNGCLWLFTMLGWFFSFWTTLVGGLMIKNDAGFDYTFFLGMDYSLAFNFAWSEVKLAQTLSAMRLLMFVLFSWDLVEELEGLVLKLKKAKGESK